MKESAVTPRGTILFLKTRNNQRHRKKYKKKKKRRRRKGQRQSRVKSLQRSSLFAQIHAFEDWECNIIKKQLLSYCQQANWKTHQKGGGHTEVSCWSGSQKVGHSITYFSSLYVRGILDKKVKSMSVPPTWEQVMYRIQSGKVFSGRQKSLDHRTCQPDDANSTVSTLQ